MLRWLREDAIFLAEGNPLYRHLPTILILVTYHATSRLRVTHSVRLIS